MDDTSEIYNPKGLSQAELIRNVYALRDLLDSGYRAQAHPSGWPEYDDRVFQGIFAALTLLGRDVDYHAHKRDLHRDGIPQATREELSTWFTYTARGEYWCTGYVSGVIEDGELQAITRRLVELLEGGRGRAPSGSPSGAKRK